MTPSVRYAQIHGGPPTSRQMVSLLKLLDEILGLHPRPTRLDPIYANEAAVLGFLRAHPGVWFSPEAIKEASQLSIAPSTVRTYCSTLQRKLGAEGRRIESMIPEKGKVLLRWAPEESP